MLAFFVLTWLPGLVGAELHVPFLRSWGALTSYAGLTWALPGLVVGLLVGRATRTRGGPHRLLGVAAGAATAGLLLLGAATIIGP